MAKCAQDTLKYLFVGERGTGAVEEIWETMGEAGKSLFAELVCSRVPLLREQTTTLNVTASQYLMAALALELTLKFRFPLEPINIASQPRRCS